MNYLRFEITSHRFGHTIALEPEFKNDWFELVKVIESITDSDIINEHKKNTPKRKSISVAINNIIQNRLVAKGWNKESAIFNDPEYNQTRWRLDFSKNNFAIEVAFNHGEAIAWNLMKPVLSSELNHVEKESQTKLGIVIMATEEMKKAGGFDGSVGTYEKAIRYLKPLQNQLSCPMVLMGLKPPESFTVQHQGKPKRATFIPKEGGINHS